MWLVNKPFEKVEPNRGSWLIPECYEWRKTHVKSFQWKCNYNKPQFTSKYIEFRFQFYLSLIHCFPNNFIRIRKILVFWPNILTWYYSQCIIVLDTYLRKSSDSMWNGPSLKIPVAFCTVTKWGITTTFVDFLKFTLILFMSIYQTWIWKWTLDECVIGNELKKICNLFRLWYGVRSQSSFRCLVIVKIANLKPKFSN